MAKVLHCDAMEHMHQTQEELWHIMPSVSWRPIRRMYAASAVPAAILAIALRQSDTRLLRWRFVDVGEHNGGCDRCDVKWAQEFLLTIAEDFKTCRKVRPAD